MKNTVKTAVTTNSFMILSPWLAHDEPRYHNRNDKTTKNVFIWQKIMVGVNMLAFLKFKGILSWQGFHGDASEIRYI